MKRCKNKIIRSLTVSQSLDFCEEVMVKMRDAGYEMIAVTSPGPDLDRVRDELGLKCIGVPMERHISVFKDVVSLFRMIHVLNKEKPQVIHSMTPKAGMISMVSGWLTGVPVRIHTFTGLVWPTMTGFKRRLLMMTDWLTCACATNVIPEGQGVMNDLYSGHITNKPMKVLGYGNVKGVDLARFDRSRFPEKKAGPFTFLFVGRIVGDKGINELVAAFTRLWSEVENVRLVLVGKYETDLDPVSESTQDRIAANPDIVLAGPKYADELLLEYVSADCFVMPSYREGFPNTVLEAGATDLPSIVTDINGSREIIENDVNGLIVPPRTENELYEAMKKMYLDVDMRTRMAGASRRIILEKFEKDFVQQCLINFYGEILKQY